VQAFLQGTDLTIAVPLTRDGEPFVPDANTLTWTLYGQSGQQMATGTLTTVTDSTAFVPVTAANNSIVAGNAFEKRTIVLSGLAGALPFVIRQAYQLIPWLNYTASADDVRTFIGIGPGELPNADIDLVSAYMDVCSYSTQAIIDAALVSANDNEREANRAIVARAVLLVIPSLQARVSKAESDGTIDVTRQDIDFNALEERASQQLSRSLDIISPRIVETPATIVFTDRPDIFRSCARS
jgi:hypothetical protein